MRHKNSYKITFMDLFLMAIGFGLAILDMNLLQEGIQKVMNVSPSAAAFSALLIATVANTFALTWGQINGKTKSKRWINSKSFVPFLAWVAFGFIYAFIEIKSHEADIASGIGQYLTLAASYIFSGLVIQMSAKDIWDADAASCRSSEKEYKLLARKVAVEDAKINSMLTELNNYNKKYTDLDEQYEKQLSAIRHAEQSVINEILGKTLQENPTILPSEARNVVANARRDFNVIEA